MSEEEMQRKMEFIVNQQALFAAGMQRMRISQSRLTDAISTVQELVGKLAEAQERMAQEQELKSKEKSEEIAESRRKLDTQFAEMRDAHAKTGERLKNFIDVVERYINERRNGQNGRAQED